MKATAPGVESHRPGPKRLKNQGDGAPERKGTRTRRKAAMATFPSVRSRCPTLWDEVLRLCAAKSKVPFIFSGEDRSRSPTIFEILLHSLTKSTRDIPIPP